MKHPRVIGLISILVTASMAIGVGADSPANPCKLPTYGLRMVDDHNQLTSTPPRFTVQQAVVLVHGLDEPGGIWNALIPRLKKAGYCVLVFFYPDDQAIHPSAVLLNQALTELKNTGLTHVNLVAHSMGGLVAREMLTHPDLTSHLPVSRLIMVGVPNHGSSLARFRMILEGRQQLLRALSNQGIFGGFLDGDGEAAADLMPNSPFLKKLNARPHPPNVIYTLIAGIASPLTEIQIKKWQRQFARGPATFAVQKICRKLIQMSRHLGDGCVSLASAQLPGITDVVIVHANHRTMLKHIFPFQKAVPPAIPIILNRLSQDAKQRNMASSRRFDHGRVVRRTSRPRGDIRD